MDQVFSEPILKLYEKRTGIRVLPVYDVEAAKTTGLVNRLITEKDHPQADVFWNGEFVQTLLLQTDGLLAPYQSPNSADIPDCSRQNVWRRRRRPALVRPGCNGRRKDASAAARGRIIPNLCSI